MADYWLGFRIKEERRRGRDRARRLNDLISTLERQGTGFWFNEASIIAIRAELPIDHLGRHIKRAVDPKVDWVVIREIGIDSTCYIGEPGQGFRAFFPKAKQL